MGRDNCTRFEWLALQLPANRGRHAVGLAPAAKARPYGPGGARLADELPPAA